MGTAVSITSAREDFAELVNRVAYGHERIVLARHGRDIVAIVPAEDVALLELIENEVDLSAARAAISDPANATPLDWTAVRDRIRG